MWGELAAWKIAAQLADALNAIHRRGLVHGGLKPSNVFITNDGHVKVLQLGAVGAASPDRPRAEVGHASQTTTEPTSASAIRRIAARRNFIAGTYESDITLVNWPMLDYVDGPMIGDDPVAAARHRDAARELALSLLHWLQTEAPRPDGGTGFPGLRPRGDVLGSGDALAKDLYIRESRRIRAEHTIVEQDVARASRPMRCSCAFAAVLANQRLLPVTAPRPGLPHSPARVGNAPRGVARRRSLAKTRSSNR